MFNKVIDALKSVSDADISATVDNLRQLHALMGTATPEQREAFNAECHRIAGALDAAGVGEDSYDDIIAHLLRERVKTGVLPS